MATDNAVVATHSAVPFNHLATWPPACLLLSHPPARRRRFSCHYHCPRHRFLSQHHHLQQFDSSNPPPRTSPHNSPVTTYIPRLNSPIPSPPPPRRASPTPHHTTHNNLLSHLLPFPIVLPLHPLLSHRHPRPRPPTHPHLHISSNYDSRTAHFPRFLAGGSLASPSSDKTISTFPPASNATVRRRVHCRSTPERPLVLPSLPRQALTSTSPSRLTSPPLPSPPPPTTTPHPQPRPSRDLALPPALAKTTTIDRHRLSSLHLGHQFST
jgi:hypothetical protein